MKCKHCGNEVQDNWITCPFCSSKIERKKLCANCGAELQPNWVSCPFCGVQVVESTPASEDSILSSLDDILPNDSDLDLVAGDIAEAKQREQEQATAEYNDKLEHARIYCICEKYSLANSIYEELLAEDIKDVNAYIGFVRIATKNYTIFEGEAIDEAIRVAKQIARKDDLSGFDLDFDDYAIRRQKYFEEQERKAAELKAKQEAERKAKEEDERKAKAEAEHKAKEEAERKAKEIEDNFEIRYGCLVKYKGKGGNIVIPNRVTSIEDYAFNGCGNITSITIPNSVKSIGDRAFSWCDNLTSITIPNSVTSIGNRAFECCYALKRITIPNSVTSIGEGVFCSCSSLTSITIPNGVTSIGNRAFFGCHSLASVSIPNSVGYIEKHAFLGCPLQTVYVNKNAYVNKDAFNYGCEIIRR